MNKQYRFTVFTQNCTDVQTNSSNNRKIFKWRLNFGQILQQDVEYKMNIESISSFNLTGDNEKFSYGIIRCPNVMSKYFYDTDSTEYCPIIFQGSLENFQNTSGNCFCYEVNPDIFNSDFTLVLDDVINDGIKDKFEVGVTFVLTEYRK